MALLSEGEENLFDRNKDKNGKNEEQMDDFLDDIDWEGAGLPTVHDEWDPSIIPSWLPQTRVGNIEAPVPPPETDNPLKLYAAIELAERTKNVHMISDSWKLFMHNFASEKRYRSGVWSYQAFLHNSIHSIEKKTSAGWMTAYLQHMRDAIPEAKKPVLTNASKEKGTPTKALKPKKTKKHV